MNHPWLDNLLADIAASPRPPQGPEGILEIPTATWHRLPEGLQQFILERRLAHRPSARGQVFTLAEGDLREFAVRVGLAERG